MTGTDLVNRRTALRLGAVSAMAGLGACQSVTSATAAPQQAPPAAPVVPAAASTPAVAPASSLSFFPGFRTVEAEIDGVVIHAVVGGSGPPLLLLHGGPQSHVMWRRQAPELAEHFTVVAADLRGYGRSGKPAAGDYSKRRMAADQVELMRGLGFERFSVAAHDRGARAARRMAKDHPAAVERLAVIDIVPSDYIFANLDRRSATDNWQWFFLAQPAPFPETLMGPQAATAAALSARPGGDPAAGRDYAATNGTPEAFHAMCEDFRACMGADIEHDAADAGQLIACPTLVLWGTQSTVARYDVKAAWRAEASDARFASIEAGHYLVEEKPQETLAALLPFLLGG